MSIRVAATALLLWSAVAQADPQASYVMECQGCHAADGSGSVASVPSLKGQVARFLTVPGGREFLVRVPGVAQAALTDAEVADLLNFLLERFGPAEIARRYPHYAADEVAKLRKTPLIDVAGTRASLARKISR